jgi:hypothetical protein
MSEILKISYTAAGGTFTVRFDDENNDVFAVDAVNQLAVDAAFERRAPVVLGVNEDYQIVRVMSQPGTDAKDPGVGGAVVTRISTQVQVSGLVAEIFYAKNAEGEEKASRTKNPVIHLLCHGAYVAKHRLELSLDEEGFITRVVKARR